LNERIEEMKMLKPIKKVSLTDSIIRQLISYIQTDLKLGEKLPSERKLIDMLGVGRTSVRESLRALEMLGIVETRAGEGSYVSRNEDGYLRKQIELGVFSTQRSVIEIYEARRVIEVGMVPVVIQNITDEELVQCRAVLNKMKTVDEGNFDLFLTYDQQFHRIIAASTRNAILSEVLKLTHRIMEEERKITDDSTKQLKKALKFHEVILEALEERDVAATVKAVEKHMDWTKTLLKI
jgi:GntR family transcriptional repressor for pyruvate dehydrogenase complex